MSEASEGSWGPLPKSSDYPSEYLDLMAENERLRAEAEQWEKEWEKARSARWAFLERDAARADNAALRDALEEIKNIQEHGIQEEGGLIAYTSAIRSWTRQALSTPHPGAALLERVRDYENSLRRISTEKNCVESSSTGMKQWFKTQGASIAQAVLEKHGVKHA